MARLGKSKSPTSTILMVLAVVALLAGIAYFLFAPSNVPPINAPSGDIMADQTPMPESGASSTAVPDASGTPEAGGTTGDPALAPLPEATSTPRPGAPMAGATSAPAGTPDSSSIVTNVTPKAEPTTAARPSGTRPNATPRPEATGEVPIPEVTPLPTLRLTPIPNNTPVSSQGNQ
jgi:hypothetical protein